MRYYTVLLSLLIAGILGLTGTASATYDGDYPYPLVRTEIHGTVESVSGESCYILTDDGDEVGVQLGPQSFWDARGYYLPEGAYVDMVAYYDPDGYTDWYFAGEIWGDGIHIVLTNDYGVPLWVLLDRDYYYEQGYRASCVSYMVWYDCPPFYFAYLILPPPPPGYYTCYYGPHWWHNYSHWYYGPRYGWRHGSYWHDGRGYHPPRERDGRRDVPGGDRPDPNWRRPDVAWHPPLARPGRPGGGITPPVTSPRPTAPAPRVSPRGKFDQWDNPVAPPVRKGPRVDRPAPSPRVAPRERGDVIVAPRHEPRPQARPVPPREERNVRPVKPAPRERAVQPRPVTPSPPRAVKAPESRRESPPQVNRSNNNPPSRGTGNSDRGRGRR